MVWDRNEVNTRKAIQPFLQLMTIPYRTPEEPPVVNRLTACLTHKVSIFISQFSPMSGSHIFRSGHAGQLEIPTK